MYFNFLTCYSFPINKNAHWEDKTRSLGFGSAVVLSCLLCWLRGCVLCSADPLGWGIGLCPHWNMVGLGNSTLHTPREYDSCDSVGSRKLPVHFTVVPLPLILSWLSTWTLFSGIAFLFVGRREAIDFLTFFFFLKHWGILWKRYVFFWTAYYSKENADWLATVTKWDQYQG